MSINAEELIEQFPIQRWRHHYDTQLEILVQDAKDKYTARKVQTTRDYTPTFCNKCIYCIRFFKTDDCASVVTYNRKVKQAFIRGGTGSYFDNYILAFVEAAPPKSKDGYPKYACDECIVRKLKSGAFRVVYVPATGYVTADTGRMEPCTEELVYLANQIMRVGLAQLQDKSSK